MKQTGTLIYIVLSITLSVTFAVPAVSAQFTKLDLLLGYGEFESCNFSKVSGIDDVRGILPTNNLSIANGWIASFSLDSKDSYTFKLVNKDNFSGDGSTRMQAGKSYQYIGIKNTSGHSLKAQYFTSLDSNPDWPDETFMPGDSFVFHIDKIIASKFVYGHQTVSIGIFYRTAGGGSTLYNITRNVDMSSGYANDVEIAFDVPNTVHVRPFIQLYLSNNNSTNDPTAILVTGAHLWVKRKGSTQFALEQVPDETNRNMQTEKICWSSEIAPARFVAKNYDAVIANAWEYPKFSLLRKLNPDIKIYLYQTAGATEQNTDVQWLLSAFKVEDVAKDHPNWLYSQTNPPLAMDPNTNPQLPNSPYVGKYLNINGFCYNYVLDIANLQMQNDWARIVIDKSKAIGADGVLIDEYGRLNLARDGVQRDQWQCQQFIHAVIPKLRAAGLASIVLNAAANLDGSTSWNGSVAEITFNPSWKPNETYPESSGYTANTPDNSPDVFFREYSFMKNNYGYDSDYWLKCISDADIVAGWNAKLSVTQTKRSIYYDVQQEDTTLNPAFNTDDKAGWATFALASFLLCKNDYTFFGAGYDQYHGFYYNDAKVDYSLSKKLGTPNGPSWPIGGDPLFRIRNYNGDDNGGLGGVVVVNADTRKSNIYVITSDCVDENGTMYPSSTKIRLLPNMGIILLNVMPSIKLSVTTPISSVVSGQEIEVTVNYENTGTAAVNKLVVQAVVPDELIYVAGSAEKTGGKYSSFTKTISWTIQTVPPKSSGSRTFKATVK